VLRAQRRAGFAQDADGQDADRAAHLLVELRAAEEAAAVFVEHGPERIEQRQVVRQRAEVQAGRAG
jgi:hypothetical protein